MSRRSAATERMKDAAAAKNPQKPASLIEDDNIRAASRGMPGERAALPPGSLPKQTPDSQGDQNMDPLAPPADARAGRGSPRDG